MRSLKLLLFFSILSYGVSAQHLLTSIPLKLTAIKNFQGYTMGDSLFISYTEKSEWGDELSKKVLVLPDGTQKFIDLPESDDKFLIGCVDSEDSIYFYYAKGGEKQKVKKKQRPDDSFTISAIVYNKVNETMSFPEWSKELPLDVFGSYQNGDLSVLYAQREDATIRIAQIHGLSVREQIFKAPPEVFRGHASQFAVIAGDDARPSEAAAHKKIYVTKNEMIISTDQFTLEATKKSTTTITRINLESGKSTTEILEYAPRQQFTTYIHNDLIYKIARDRAFYISISDLNKQLLSSFVIDKKSSYSKQPTFIRETKTRRVYNIRTVWEAIDNGGDPFITVHPYDSGSILLKVGRHTKLSGGLPLPMPIPFPIIGSLGWAVFKISTDNGETFDHYFYLKGNPKDGFTYVNNAGDLVDQRIDSYELFDKKNRVGFKFKGYLKNNKNVYGIYRTSEAPRELSIVAFKR